jgi:hypothetical protein
LRTPTHQSWRLQRAALVADHAVFVRGADVSHIAAAVDDGQAAVERHHLEAGVADRLAGLRAAHHRGQDEQRVLPFALVDAMVVGVASRPAKSIVAFTGVPAVLEQLVGMVRFAAMMTSMRLPSATGRALD